MNVFVIDKKMKTIRTIVLVFVGLYSSLLLRAQIVPTDIAGLSLWLSADSINQESGTPVEVWASNDYI